MPAQDQPKEGYDLGVLFVHGIGDQRQNTTLARFGGSLERWLRRGIDPAAAGSGEPPAGGHIAAPPAVEVEAVEDHTDDGDSPAHARLRVGPVEPAESRQRWLLAEGWWAAEASPPTFKAFVRWVLPMLPWVAAEYVVAASGRNQPQRDGSGRDDPAPGGRRRPGWFDQIESLSLSGVLWLLSPVIAVLTMLACLVLALLQRVPVVGRRVNAATAKLVTGVGDAYLFADDALARAAMLQRIRRNLDWLDQQGCEKVAIVAHSQGAALCHDLLRSAALRPRKPVDLLVTVGSGVRRLNEFRNLYDDARLRSLGWVSIAGLVALVTGTTLVLGGLGTSGDAGLWAAVGALAIVAGSVIVSPASRAPQRPGELLIALGAAVLLGAGLLADGPGRPLLVAGAVSMPLSVWLYRRAAEHVRTHVEAVSELALPYTAVRRWVDFYSSADPVPNGELRTWTRTGQRPGPPPAVHPDPRLVYNLRSVQADHSAYFHNTDEFVSQLALELAGESRLTGRPLVAGDRLRRARDRRRWRTSCRGSARNLLLAAALLGAIAITSRTGGGPGWAGLGADAGVAAGPPYGNLGRLAQWVQDWLGRLPLAGGLTERVAVQPLAGMLLGAAAVVAAALVLGRLWSVWDANDIDRFFLEEKRQTLGTWRALWPPWAFLGLTGLLVVAVMAAVDGYTGRSWLVLAALGGGLLLTATRVWVAWGTCLGRPAGQGSTIGARTQPDRLGAG